MRTPKIASTLAIVMAGLTAPGLTTAASAAVTVTSSGTIVTVNATGNANIHLGCPGGNFAAGGIVASPTVPCAAVTQLRVTGDAGAQTVFARTLNDAAYAAAPTLEADLGDGDDVVYDTARADKIDAGPGDDFVDTTLGVADLTIDLDSGTDWLWVRATDPTVLTASSTGSTVTISRSGPTSSVVASGAELLNLFGSSGADTIDASGVSLSSTIVNLELDGEEGDDTIIGGPAGVVMYGDAGTNSFEPGTGYASIWSTSSTDTIVGHPAGTGVVNDSDSLRSGTRTLQGDMSDYEIKAFAVNGDTVSRVRPGAGSSIVRTFSLHRSGQQQIPAAVDEVVIHLAQTGQVTHRNIVDVVAVPAPVAVTGETADTDILDVTVPTGTWTLNASGDGVTVYPNDPGLERIVATNVADYRVHGPWTNANQGFVHRVYRDLMFAFPSDAWRDQVRDQLTAGTRSRAHLVSTLMGTDSYRGLDVDRVFVSFLRRPSDPGGRTYWIGSLRNGKTLRQFRAQLFGSNEYFNNAGANNIGFMVQAYADVMGRAPDAAGQAYWVGRLDAGLDRGVMARTFLASTEARRNLVNDQFLRFIDREANLTEQNHWIGVLGSNTTDGERTLVASLANSATYYNRS